MACYAKTIDQHEADYKAWAEQQRILRGNASDFLQTIQFEDTVNDALKDIARIKYDLQNP